MVETLLQIGLFLVIFVVVRTIVEPIVRLQLITILGDLAGGVLIGVSGLHLIVLPETHAQVSGPALLARLVGGHQAQRGLYRFKEASPSFQTVSEICLFSLLFRTGLESELDEIVAVTGVALLFALGAPALCTSSISSIS